MITDGRPLVRGPLLGSCQRGVPDRASRAHLQAVARELLDDHLRHCVADAITHGGREVEDKLAEASAAIARLLKS